MNNGANIVYIGSAELIRQPGDKTATNLVNRTELYRSYAIRKSHASTGRATLIEGYRAEGYANMTLMTPPTERTDAAFTYFDCVFTGILNTTEGGRSDTYESVDKGSDVGDVYWRPGAGVLWKMQAILPTQRFGYTVQKDSDSRAIFRVVPSPATVQCRVTRIIKATGNIIKVNFGYPVPGIFFTWNLLDVDRTNFSDVDEVLESWGMTPDEINTFSEDPTEDEEEA